MDTISVEFSGSFKYLSKRFTWSAKLRILSFMEGTIPLSVTAPKHAKSYHELVEFDAAARYSN